MPPLVPPVVPTGQLNFAYEIMQAAKAALDADPNTMVGGNLGVNAVIIAKKIPDGSELILDWSAVGKCPAYMVWAEVDESDWAACGTTGYEYNLELFVVVERLRTLTGGLQTKDQLVENGLSVLRAAISTYTGTWLTSDSGVIVNGATQSGSFEEAQKMRRREVSRSVIPLQVVHNAPTGGPF